MTRRTAAVSTQNGLTIAYRNLRDLEPYARNARTHSADQLKQIRQSLLRFGWTIPMVVAGKAMRAGHARLQSAIALAEAGSAIPNNPDPWKGPVIDISHLSETDQRAYILADNRIALNAGWDDELLRGELQALKVEAFDVLSLGFSEGEVFRLLSAEPSPDADHVPEPPPAPVTRPGDIWRLGAHRLMCGDSTSAEDMAALADGRLADMCFTSPPYGQQREYEGGVADWDALMRGVFTALPLKPEAQLLVNLGMVHREGEWMPYWDGWIAWMREQGWRRFGWYVWDQGHGLPGDWGGRLAPSHEWLFHFNRVADRARKTKASKMAGVTSNGGLRSGPGDATHKRNKGPSAIQANKIPDSVVRVTRHKGGLGDAGSHPAVFPVDLVSEMLMAFSDPGDVVVEPFSGSGTQLVSAEKQNRICLAMEIAPAYCDVAIRRWEAVAAEKAVLARTGRTFAEMAEERAAVEEPALAGE